MTAMQVMDRLIDMAEYLRWAHPIRKPASELFDRPGELVGTLGSEDRAALATLRPEDMANRRPLCA